MYDGNYYLSLTDLLDRDISSYEYFNSQPPEIQRKIVAKDICSFSEMHDYVNKIKS